MKHSMKQTSLSAFTALAGISLFSAAPRAQAKDVYLGSLESAVMGGMHASSELKLALTDDKPAGITVEPHYAYKPHYGTLALGNAKNNQIAVVLDTDGTTNRPKLYVDANGNGDLTDDPPVVFAPAKAVTASGAEIISTTPSKDLTAIVPVITHYDVAGRGGVVPSALSFNLHGTELTYNREYARTGTLTVGGRTYRIALVDQAVNGKFNDFQHSESDPSKVTLFIDKNRDGRFDPATEAFDAGKPFRLSGKSYEVASIDVRGMAMILRNSGKNTSTLTAADMKVGANVMDFEAQLLDGKTIHFPDDYKGKVVMLDFWATWCPPCREEVPNIVAVYNQFHPRGFEILGVSLDRANQGNVLKQFMGQFGMSWAQIYDGGYWKAEVAQQFDVNSIPHSLLVDGNTGKILAMGETLRGQGLQHSLQAAFTRNR